MGSAIGKVRAVFTASTAGLTSGVNSASASMKRMQSEVSALRSRMGALVAINGAQLFGSLASSASSAVSSLVRMGQAEAEVIDSTSKMAARLGMTYGELAGLSYAGSLADVSLETLAGAATKADVAFVKAATGSATAISAFKSLGLSVGQLDAMSSAERFDAIAESISRLPTAAERSAAAVKLFGRAGAQLLPLFSEGAGGIAAARREAEAFGLTLNTVQGKNVEAMNDAFTRAQQAVSGVVQQIVAYLAPAIENVTNGFSALVAGVGGQNIGQAIGEGILQGALFFAGIADNFVAGAAAVFDYAKQVIDYWGGVADVLNGVGTFFYRVGAFISGVFNTAVTLLRGVILTFYKPIELLAMVAGEIASVFGFDTQFVDDVVSAARGFGLALEESTKAAAEAAQKDFAVAFGYAEPAIKSAAIEGGQFFTDNVKKGMEASRKALTAVDVPSDVKVAKIDAAPVAQALKGIDSRSREGVSEMFRLMRGGGGDVAEQQLAVQERIAAGIDRLNEGDGIAEFAF